jgi:hypothetical protein
MGRPGSKMNHKPGNLPVLLKETFGGKGNLFLTGNKPASD